MEAVNSLLVCLLLVLLQVMGTSSDPLSNEEQEAEWRLGTLEELPLKRGQSLRLAELIKRPKAQQFHGLMGRSSGTSHSVRLGRKREFTNAQRNKYETFVGLMGRRSLRGDSEEDWDIY